jgi:hypothetical protein
MKKLFGASFVMLLAVAVLPAEAQNMPVPAAANPAPTAAPVDPARLAAAEITVNSVYPAGTTARLLNGSLNGMFDKIIGSSTQIPLSEIATLSGQAPAEVAKLGKGTIADIMAIYDPAYQQRMSLFMHTFLAGMGDIMAQAEPSIREGMVEAYASRFSLAQLSDINRFFATPSGQAYAANIATIQTDPAVMSRMQAIYPQLFQQMPAIVEKAKQATASLPAQKKFSDLTPAERAKLAGLLGVPEAQLEANAAKK